MKKKARLRIPLPDDANDHDMAGVLDALTAARNAMLGVMNQPRCSDVVRDVIIAEMDRLAEVEDTVLDRLTTLPVINDYRHAATLATILTALMERGLSANEMLATFATTLAKVDKGSKPALMLTDRPASVGWVNG